MDIEEKQESFYVMCCVCLTVSLNCFRESILSLKVGSKDVLYGFGTTRHTFSRYISMQKIHFPQYQTINSCRGRRWGKGHPGIYGSGRSCVARSRGTGRPSVPFRAALSIIRNEGAAIFPPFWSVIGQNRIREYIPVVFVRGLSC